MRGDIIARAWKDRKFRLSLSDQDRSALPEHPSGAVELPEAALSKVHGGQEAATSLVCVTVGASALLSCWFNCDTLVKGSCGAFSVGCCTA